MEEKSGKREHRNYSKEFKLQVLKDIYENDLSDFFTARKYGIASHQSEFSGKKRFR